MRLGCSAGHKSWRNPLFSGFQIFSHRRRPALGRAQNSILSKDCGERRYVFRHDRVRSDYTPGSNGHRTQHHRPHGDINTLLQNWMYGFHHASLIPRIFWSETAKVHQRNVFSNSAGLARQDSKGMWQMQPLGERPSYLRVQNMLQNPAKPLKIILPHQTQIKIGYETISYVWIYWMNGRPLHI